MKTLKCIDYQQGKILVDEQAEIKKGDLILVNNEILTAGGLADTYGDDHRKIIAQTSNFNLEGVPFIELEEDVERLFEEHGISKQDERSKLLFLKGYKAAQPKKYTEDDLRKAIAEAWNACEDNEDNETFTQVFNRIIQSLQPKIVSVEVEMEMGEVFNGIDSQTFFRPTTYQKDGRTYLKINKINYGN